MRYPLLFLFSFGLLFGLFAQEELSRKEKNKARPKYLELGTLTGPGYHRDLATSPLFNRGGTVGTNFHYHRFDSLRETRYGFTLLAGFHGFTVGNERSGASLTTVQFDFNKLYAIHKISQGKYKFKVGGMVVGNFNLRIDPRLQNAGFGNEFIYNLMGSAKVSRDVSRKSTKSGKILWLFPYNWEPRKRLLSYQLNVGIYNANVRNGYAYVDQSGLINELAIWSDYEHNAFSGFRVNAALRYTIYLNNDNALRFSYNWDAYTTGGDVDQFEIANHLLGVALLFDLSNW